MKNPLSNKWKNENFILKSHSWIKSELKNNNYHLDGEIDQFHVRPWSTVFKIPTNNGILYFKACSPILLHEVLLTNFLANQKLNCSLEIISINEKERFLLMKDSGQAMRLMIQKEQTADNWFKVLPQFASLQIKMIDFRDQLLNMGVYDRRLSILPELFRKLLDHEEVLLIGQKEGMTLDQRNKLKECIPQFKSMCRELSDYDIPETLHHDDFHDNNIFVKNEVYTFADWGESCISHPFFSLIIVLRITAYILKLKENDPLIEEVRDSYLLCWDKYASYSDLLKAFELAKKIGMINRALTWYQIVTNLTDNEKKEYSEAVPGWLMDFYDAMDLNL